MERRRTYDTLNRLTNLAAVLNGTTSITNFTYVYDNAGNRTRKQQLDYTEDYGYDPLYRLISVSRTGSTQPSEWAYGYDPVGNRTTEQVDNNLLTAVYDQRNELNARGTGGSLALHVRGALNEPGTVTVNSAPARMGAGNTFDADVTTASGPNTLSLVARDVSGNQTTANYSVSLSGAGATYTHDANGNLAQKVDSGITTTYTRDAQNRLLQVQNNGSTVATFAYDALGRRVQKVAGGVTTTWTYDGDAILRQVAGWNAGKGVEGSSHGKVWPEKLLHLAHVHHPRVVDEAGDDRPCAAGCTRHWRVRWSSETRVCGSACGPSPWSGGRASAREETPSTVT